MSPWKTYHGTERVGSGARSKPTARERRRLARRRIDHDATGGAEREALFGRGRRGSAGGGGAEHDQGGGGGGLHVTGPLEEHPAIAAGDEGGDVGHDARERDASGPGQ